MRSVARTRKIFAILVLATTLSLSSAWAQNTVDQADREVDRKVREAIERKLVTPPKEPPKIEEEAKEEKPEGPSFFLRKINLEGVKSFPPEDFSRILSEYENRQATVSTLKTAAEDIEREYLAKGVIAACIVPPQDVKDGVAVLRVVEAKMGDLIINPHKYFFKNNLRFYWHIKPGETLRYDKISRSIQLMNKNPDREVKSTLHAGKKPQTTDVMLDAKTRFPIHMTASIDNEGSVSTGKIRKGLGAIHNNALGLDDTFVAGSSFGKDFAGMYFYHKLPVTGHGTHLLYGYNRSSSFPKKDYQYLDMNSKVESGSVFVYQDIFDRDRYRGYLSFGVEAKDKRVVTNAGAFHTDRDRIMRFGGAFVDQGQGNVTLLTPEYSQGINLFGASRKSPLSSRNAENTFSKFLFTGEFTQLLYGNFRAHLKTSCQLASEKLTPQEEFFLGGINSIRGYPWGDYLADGAFYTNFELLIPAFFLPNWLKVPYGERPLKEEITGLAFFDYGYGCKRGSREGEGTARRLAGAGPGVRIRLFNQALLRIEIGFPLDNMANLPETEFDRWRVHFTFEFEDRFPEEIERLQKALKAGQV